MSGGEEVPEGYTLWPRPHPYESHVALLYRRRGPSPRFAFRAGPQHANTRGLVHGGMLMSFADSILGIAGFMKTRKDAATVSQRTDFLRPVRVGDLVECAPVVQHEAGGLVFVDGHFTVGGETVFTVRALFKSLGDG